MILLLFFFSYVCFDSFKLKVAIVSKIGTCYYKDYIGYCHNIVCYTNQIYIIIKDLRSVKCKFPNMSIVITRDPRYIMNCKKMRKSLFGEFFKKGINKYGNELYNMLEHHINVFFTIMYVDDRYALVNGYKRCIIFY